MKMPFVRMNRRAQDAAARRLFDAMQDTTVDGVDARTVDGVFAFDDDMQPVANVADARWIMAVVAGKAALSRVDNAGVMHAVAPD